MADRIKGITIDINGNTTGLSKALKDVNKDLYDTQKELKDVERLLKLDPKNTELLRQKQKLLNNEVEATKTKLTALRNAEKQVQEQFKQGKVSEQQYDALKREIISTEASLKSLTRQSAEANLTLTQIGNTANTIANGANKVAAATRRMSMVAIGALTGIGALIYKEVQNADDLLTKAQQTGFDTETLQKFIFASERIDVGTETIIGALTRLKSGIKGGSNDFVNAVDELGVSLTDANGESRSIQDVFFEIVSALGNIADETDRDTLAMTLFGRSANELAGLIDDGGEKFRQLAEEAENVKGAVLGESELNALNEFSDRIDKMKQSLKGILAEKVVEWVETGKMEEAFTAIENIIEKIVDWLDKMDVSQIEALVTALGVIAASSAVATVIGGIATAVNAVSAACKTAIPLLSKVTGTSIGTGAASAASGAASGAGLAGAAAGGAGAAAGSGIGKAIIAAAGTPAAMAASTAIMGTAAGAGVAATIDDAVNNWDYSLIRNLTKPIEDVAGLAWNGIEKLATAIDEAFNGTQAPNKPAQTQTPEVHIFFEGELAQLGRVLAPVIDKEVERVGGGFVKATSR